MKVLVLGAGQVATALRDAAEPSLDVVSLGRADLDITDGPKVQRIVRELAPHWIVNAAAYTAVDLAESEADQAFAVNDTAVANLAIAAAQVNARLLHISTDFVFDGTSSRAYLPNDSPAPINAYGRSKLAGERWVLEKGPGVVLRTSWVYASRGRNFVLTMLGLMRERPALSVVADQIGAPTWARSVASAIWGFIVVAAPAGIYHWTDLGVASWYDFAVAIQDEALECGLLKQPRHIEPITSNQYGTAARRPSFSVLDTTRSRRLLSSVVAMHWRHNLKIMLNEL